jgi:hypothetical protein
VERLNMGAMAAQRRRPLLVALVVACLTPGCAIRTGMTLTGWDNLADTPAGPVAVLRVVTHLGQECKSAQVIWGKVEAPNAPERFAELLASAAADTGGLDVIHPVQVVQKLEAAGLATTLQPDDEELAERIRALGCAAYLVAEIDCWEETYVFFASSAVIEYSIACHVPGRREPVWRVRARNVRRNTTHRELAAQALRETFRALKVQRDVRGWREHLK